MATATKSYQAIRTHVESIKNDEPQSVETMSTNDAWAQGDVAIIAIDKITGKPDPKPVVQLAPGTTQGSRHCLDSLDGIQLFRVDRADVLTGPQIKADRRFTVEHPEHGDVSLPPGNYQIRYQRAFAEELRRVADGLR